MDKKAILAICVVAILLIAGVGCYLVVQSDDDDDKVEYDPSKGWYSWDPIVVKYPTGRMSFSPQLLNEVEKMYQTIYGDLPDYSKYSKSDVPADFLSFKTAIQSEDANSITVTSSIRVASGSSEYKHDAVTIPKGNNHLLTVGSNAALLKQMLETNMTSAEAEAKTWEIVYGLDKSAFPGGSADLTSYGMTIPDSVVQVATTYYLVDQMDAYSKYIEDCTKTSNDNLIMMFSGALKNSYDELKPFFDMCDQASPGKAFLVGTFCTNLSDVFAGIEMFGAMFDLKDVANDYINDLRFKFWAMHEESTNKNLGYEAYIESTAGTAGGTGTIINDVITNVLSLKNISTHQQWTKISDEIVIEKQPKVLIFQSSDKRTDDERMRVGTVIGSS